MVFHTNNQNTSISYYGHGRLMFVITGFTTMGAYLIAFFF